MLSILTAITWYTSMSCVLVKARDYVFSGFMIGLQVFFSID